METFVLRWTKDNVPFWQGVDDGEKIEINAVADVINENAALKRENKTKSDALAGAQVFAIELKQENEALKRAIRYEHTLDGGNECLKARQGIRCEICALLTKETNDEA